MNKVGWFMLGVLVGAGVVFVAQTYPRYHREMRVARERLLASSHVIRIPSGLIEYATAGKGYPVLAVHGAGGGYDQGLFLSGTFLGDGFQRIAPSRFGFLRTPVPADGSHAAQADAFAELLDVLDISRVALVGISAGGPSALQFALRYPERCSALVMVSAISHTDRPMGFGMKIVHHVIFRSDFLFWFIAENFRSSLVSFWGVSKEVQARFTPAEED